MLYVSITGMRVRSAFAMPRFVWHAVRSMAQARSADGILFAEARRIGGVHHTLTVWRSREHMLAYLSSGAHRQAMRAFADLGTGTTFGYTAPAFPSWDDALAEWAANGRPAGRPHRPDAERSAVAE
ncbi:hypothetical protein [Chthonobacter rhizosphaerae]|uniref:hypothetical protein n=1 Tax=Chthonobacter rhizosphaerae TaxID=2735553 RepID=UPI0015EF2730|nr:hypothetical protein [Chthonobacter rhizosphaerae]